MRIKKNGKVVNLTESDLRRITKRFLNEQVETECIPLYNGGTALAKLQCCLNKKEVDKEIINGLTKVPSMEEAWKLGFAVGAKVIQCMSVGPVA